jgi:ferritin-like metal-binding protein YciE
MLNTRQGTTWTPEYQVSKARKNYKRHERKDQIEQVILEHLYMHRKAMSMRQVAKAIGLTPQRTITDILDEMVSEGRLISKRFKYKGGAVDARFEYTIPPAKLAAGVAGAVGVGDQQS